MQLNFQANGEMSKTAANWSSWSACGLRLTLWGSYVGIVSLVGLIVWACGFSVLLVEFFLFLLPVQTSIFGLWTMRDVWVVSRIDSIRTLWKAVQSNYDTVLEFFVCVCLNKTIIPSGMKAFRDPIPRDQPSELAKQDRCWYVGLCVNHFPNVETPTIIINFHLHPILLHFRSVSLCMFS